MKLKAFILFILCANHTFMYAQQSKTTEPTFGIGSVVNEYPAVQWIQGEPVARFDKDKIYIVECWATWCGPCVAAIPHLNELHKKLGDKIVIIGQNIWETNKARAAAFVKEKGSGMSYRVAFGGGKESDFSLKWMEPAGINGIPQTFIIQNNKVVWMPHPAQLTEEALQLLIDGKFSLDAVKALSPHKKYERIRQLIGEQKYEMAMPALDTLLQRNPYDESGLAMKYSLFIKMGKTDENIAYFKKTFNENPTPTVVFIYYKLLTDNKHWDLLAKTAQARITEQPEDVESMLAWIIALNEQGNLKAAATLLDQFTTSSKNPSTLMRLAFIDRLTPSGKTNPEIEKIMFKAGEKSLDLDVDNLYLLSELVKRAWKANNKALAKKITAKVAIASKKNPEQQKLAEIVSQLLDYLKKDILPSEEQFKNWNKEIQK